MDENDKPPESPAASPRGGAEPPERLWWIGHGPGDWDWHVTISHIVAEFARKANRPVVAYLPATPAREAAGELLACLEAIAAFEPTPGDPRNPSDDPYHQIAVFAKQTARDAIAKARPGGTPKP